MSEWHQRHRRSRPRAARGGIKSQSERGSFGESWWAKRWISVLESFNIGGRLQRGRSYARSGQVLSIAIQKGRVLARVQGSRPKPYDISIKVKTLSPAQWRRVVKLLAGQAMYTAALLAGEMPHEIEHAFKEAGVSLFPSRAGDLKTSCSCPDWANPCKHIAAVYYLLGEEFDRDPFLIFKLRGMTRDELVAALSGGRRPQAGEGRGKRGRRAARRGLPTEGRAPEPRQPLGHDPHRFFAGGDFPQQPPHEVQSPPVPAPLLNRLGSFPLWRGEERFLDALAPLYTAAASRGLDVLLGEVLEENHAAERRRG
jgi:uncharacterized Zn finger protein